jgi:hypothetical protein
MPEQERQTGLRVSYVGAGESNWTTGELSVSRIDELEYGLAMSEQDRQTGLRVSYA